MFRSAQIVVDGAGCSRESVPAIYYGIRMRAKRVSFNGVQIARPRPTMMRRDAGSSLVPRRPDRPGL